MNEQVAQRLKRPLTVFAQRAPDVAGQWVAHCLDLDVVSQGDNPTQALEMIAEAVAILVVDDLMHGLNPFDRASAPKEHWQEMRDAIRYGTQAPRADEDPGLVDAIIAQMRLSLDERAVTAALPAWQIAAVQAQSEAASQP